MDRTFQKILAVVVVFWTAFACSSDPDDVLLIWDIDGAITLRLEEVILEDRSHLQFDLLTEDFAFCQGASIVQRVSIDNRVVDVRIVGVSQGNGCSNPEEHAGAILPLDELENGNYNIQLNLSNRLPITGLLALSDDDYKIDFNANQSIIVPNSTLNKTPINLVIVVTEWYDEENDEATIDFLNKISDNATFRSLPDGIYQHFEIRSGDILLFDNLGLNIDATTAFLFEGTEEQLSTIHKEWNEDWGDSGILKLINAQGTIYE